MTNNNRFPFALSFLLAGFLGSIAARAGTPPPGQAELKDFRQIINAAKDKVFPSVVFLMPLAERFDEGRREQSQVSGSGVIISESGEVATNWHVVEKALSIRCLLYDGTIGRARVIGADKDTDIALLQLEIPGRTQFPHARFGDSDRLVEGEFVMAMGAPWGLSRSVSLGIVSCTTRFLDGLHTGGYNLWIQTDASINPGNSGGPLVNTSGEVIGINTLAMVGGASLAFSVPSNVAITTLNALREHGRVPRAWTGLRLQPLKDFARDIFYEGEGVMVGGVDRGSPAEAAGIRPGDIIQSINGQVAHGVNLENLPALNQLLAELTIGQESEIVLLRGTGAEEGEEYGEDDEVEEYGDPDAEDEFAPYEDYEGEDTIATTERARVAIRLTPVEKGQVEGDDFDCRSWNFTAKSINEFATPRIAFHRPTGAYVQGIKQPGNALAAGLHPGDILLTVDGKDIESLDDLKVVYQAVADDAGREKKVRITFLRAGLTNHTVLDYATQYGQKED